MESEDFNARLKKVEETLSSLEFQQDCCRPFIKLAEMPLTDINNTFKSYLTQLSDIESDPLVLI